VSTFFRELLLAGVVDVVEAVATEAEDAATAAVNLRDDLGMAC